MQTASLPYPAYCTNVLIDLSEFCKTYSSQHNVDFLKGSINKFDTILKDLKKIGESRFQQTVFQFYGNLCEPCERVHNILKAFLVQAEKQQKNFVLNENLLKQDEEKLKQDSGLMTKELTEIRNWCHIIQRSFLIQRMREIAVLCFLHSERVNAWKNKDNALFEVIQSVFKLYVDKFNSCPPPPFTNIPTLMGRINEIIESDFSVKSLLEIQNGMQRLEVQASEIRNFPDFPIKVF